MSKAKYFVLRHVPTARIDFSKKARAHERYSVHVSAHPDDTDAMQGEVYVYGQGATEIGAWRAARREVEQRLGMLERVNSVAMPGQWWARFYPAGTTKERAVFRAGLIAATRFFHESQTFPIPHDRTLWEKWCKDLELEDLRLSAPSWWQ